MNSCIFDVVFLLVIHLENHQVFRSIDLDMCINTKEPIPEVARSKAARLLGLRGSNPVGAMDVCPECSVFSGRGLCDGLITCPDDFYRVWCI